MRSVIWMLTEADGKYATRFRSFSARKASPKEIQHEHVFPILFIFEQFAAGHWDESRVIDCAVGCLVTRAEHQELSTVDRASPAPIGWKRYLAAGIKVFDEDSQSELDLTRALP